MLSHFGGWVNLWGRDEWPSPLSLSRSLVQGYATPSGWPSILAASTHKGLVGKVGTLPLEVAELLLI